jgi:transposase InsO family protein
MPISKDLPSSPQQHDDYDLRLLHHNLAIPSGHTNALAESFNASLKREVLQDNTSWPDEQTCRREVFRWLTRYNLKRRHSYCRYLSPANYERLLTPATLPQAA